MKRRFLAVPLGLILALWTTGIVSAVTPQGSLTVDTDGCNVTLHISLQGQPEVAAWAIKKFHKMPGWFAGETVLEGTGTPDADGNLTVGPLTLPEGQYNAAADDEDGVDHSALVTEFTVSCPAASESPSESPSQSTEPSQGTPPPSGSELPAQGTPRITPPATDSGVVATTSSDDSGARLALIGVLALVVGSLFVARAARPSTVPVRRGRDDR